MKKSNYEKAKALRIEALSINCILAYVSWYAANRNLLTVAESLTAVYVEYLLLMRLILLIHMIRRTPKVKGNTVLTYDEGGQTKYALGRLTSVVKILPRLVHNTLL